MWRYLFLMVLLTVISYGTYGQDSTKVGLTYGSKGWKLTYGSEYEMNLQWRVQIRTTFLTNEPDFFVPEEDNVHGSIDIQRARLKVGGHAFNPDLKYYLEYDFPSNNLLNWQLHLTKFKPVQFKVGQWKVEHNTERFVSSGKQQFVDRSISNRYFTLDRQMGAMLLGTLFDKKILSSNYYIGIFNGNGRGETNTDSNPMLFARYEWNFSRTVAKKSFSDLERASRLEGFLGASWMHNQSAFTSFSSAGGGQLPGFTEGRTNQYEVGQFAVELYAKYAGLSIVSENHIKNINDLETGVSSRFSGGYAMVGYFFSELIPAFPEKLELITRYARVNLRNGIADNQEEISFGANWFFKGHLNKLTLDTSVLKNQDFDSDLDDVRVRLQWDISF